MKEKVNRLFQAIQEEFSGYTAFFKERFFPFLITALPSKAIVKSSSESAYRWAKGFSIDAAKRVIENPKHYAVLAIAGMMIFAVLFGNHGIIQRIRLEMQVASIQKELQEEEAKRIQLEAKLKRTSEPDEIERLAREKYHLSKEGETVYIIK
ncbi:MAG: septum formation initiator family protein [Chloroherpetonaceae bacterium]|nr:septum formation initiator family protein [Chloroherpetonaceae bacterium]